MEAKNKKLQAQEKKAQEGNNKTSQPYLEPAKKDILKKLKE